MNRIEKVREHVDAVLLAMKDTAERRCGYLHLYGVSQACALIALKRNENAELAVIAGMLHDIYSYSAMDTKEHAHKGSIMAREILDDMKIFAENEVDMICSAIYNHSSKAVTQSPFDEVLKDADVLQHCLYNPLFDVKAAEKARYEKIKSELGIDHE